MASEVLFVERSGLCAVRVHPTVVLSILEQYVRRDMEEGRTDGNVIGEPVPPSQRPCCLRLMCGLSCPMLRAGVCCTRRHTSRIFHRWRCGDHQLFRRALQ